MSTVAWFLNAWQDVFSYGVRTLVEWVMANLGQVAMWGLAIAGAAGAVAFADEAGIWVNRKLGRGGPVETPEKAESLVESVESTAELPERSA